MAIDLLKDKGVPLEKQRFTWREMVQTPSSKLDDDAMTHVRIILMNGIMSDGLRFSHIASRMNGELRPALARLRRVEQHQQTTVNWLLPGDMSPLETTIGFEQVAIEVTAAVAQQEPDEYLAQVYRFGLLEDFDHMYRYSALMDRVEGKDANEIVKSYSDILPGRPTSIEHRHPDDDLREPYQREQAALVSKLNAITITAGEFQTHDYYMTVGPTFTDPTARALYAEIASIEEQHVTQYGSLMDPGETLLEKLLLHQACQVYNYFSCVEYEENPRIKKIWERFLEYELGQLRFVADLFEKVERREAAEILGDGKLPKPIEYVSHRAYVREVLEREVELSALGTTFVDRDEESEQTLAYRKHLNSAGSPSDLVSGGYTYTPGTELTLEPTDGRSRVTMPEQRSPR